MVQAACDVSDSPESPRESVSFRGFSAEMLLQYCKNAIEKESLFTVRGFTVIRHCTDRGGAAEA
jgi:hypothetical protein